MGGLVGFFALFITNAIYKLWKGIDGFGFGDFKLLAALGTWFGATYDYSNYSCRRIGWVACSGFIIYALVKD